ncbi:MAG TPA: YbaB/EbfC family nucleoid-associated protein [Clostridiales bacterium]|jgi:hypothetical protein|nr:YbaB/EbfC family nucleoid-associated protein [Clostridiales bacterium]
MKARLPKGMGKGPENMNSMLKQAQKMQEDMAALQEDLNNREYEIKAGGGMVTLKMKGTKEVVSLHIQPDVIDPDDPETLQDILIAAFNEGIKRIEDTNKNEMESITGALNMPGLF